MLIDLAFVMNCLPLLLLVQEAYPEEKKFNYFNYSACVNGDATDMIPLMIIGKVKSQMTSIEEPRRSLSLNIIRTQKAG